MKKKSLINYIIYPLIDAVIIFAISFLAALGCYGRNVFLELLPYIAIFNGCLSILSVLVLFLLKTYRTDKSTFGFGDLIRVVFVETIAYIAGTIVLYLVPIFRFEGRFIISFATCYLSTLFLLTFIRVVPRLYRMLVNRINGKDKIRTLVIGAGLAAKIVVDDSRSNPASRNKIVVLMDDDPTKFDSLFSNIPVKGPVRNVKQVIEKYNVEEVIIAISSLTEYRLHEMLEYLKDTNVRVRRMPLLTEMEGPYEKHIIDVDIDSLLDRDGIKLDNDEVSDMLHGKVVLVTGAGGSIGSELVRQIFATKPSRLILFDIYENSTYDIQQELTRKIKNEKIKDVKLTTLIGSTYNEFRVEQIISKYKPDYIYHAAAYKHVPLMEDSPAEAIRTNVLGTYNVAKLANKYKVKKMVLVSTDKAVRPTNTMGATKRFAETIIQYFSSISKSTAFAAVRFGNVLGSNGSVVPLFKKQIEEGGPITLTHKDIIRYFMTIPEAVSLILQCGLYATGGEIFILDMGKPVKIYDLAIKLIHQAGLIPEKDIKIVETGLRPGEKLFEELLINTKTQKRTANKRIFIEEPESIKPIEEEIKTISKAFNMQHKNDVKELLASIIDTYTVDFGNK